MSLSMSRPAIGGAACGVLEGHWIAETGQQTLLVTLHDDTVKPMYCLRAFLLEAMLHLDLILCVKSFQIGFGLKQVAAADQEGHLATFGGLRSAGETMTT